MDKYRVTTQDPRGDTLNFFNPVYHDNFSSKRAAKAHAAAWRRKGHRATVEVLGVNGSYELLRD